MSAELWSPLNNVVSTYIHLDNKYGSDRIYVQ